MLNRDNQLCAVDTDTSAVSQLSDIVGLCYGARPRALKMGFKEFSVVVLHRDNQLCAVDTDTSAVSQPSDIVGLCYRAWPRALKMGFSRRAPQRQSIAHSLLFNCLNNSLALQLNSIETVQVIL